jgi:hypothetical protein
VSARVIAARGAETVDVRGLFVVPGLIVTLNDKCRGAIGRPRRPRFNRIAAVTKLRLCRGASALQSRGGSARAGQGRDGALHDVKVAINKETTRSAGWSAITGARATPNAAPLKVPAIGRDRRLMNVGSKKFALDSALEQAGFEL